MSHRAAATVAFALTAVVALGWSLPGAVAHENPNHGTIKVHDEEIVDPEAQNQQHVCSFWIQGFDMTDGNGTLVFTLFPPDSNPPREVLVVEWTADNGSEVDGYAFTKGPLSLPDGHYRVEAFVDDPDPHSREHSSKSKVFWVECSSSECPGPHNLTATADDQENITLNWSPVGDAEMYTIYRAIGTGTMEVLTVVSGNVTSFRDDDVRTGLTYQYRVTAVVNEGEETAYCDTAVAMAIPDLPGALAMGLAGGSGLAAYALLRRRKA